MCYIIYSPWYFVHAIKLLTFCKSSVISGNKVGHCCWNCYVKLWLFVDTHCIDNYTLTCGYRHSVNNTYSLRG